MERNEQSGRREHPGADDVGTGVRGAGRQCLHMTGRIEDYAMIGDCETAALVGKDGSIDWLCLPRFDSPACFAALLGTPEHGRWLIRPANGSSTVSRQYLRDTLILETQFETQDGTAKLIDFMPL